MDDFGKRIGLNLQQTAFFLFGELIELESIDKLFTTPRDSRTADYISGRFG